MRGLFITFEGPDGSGKTSQLKRLAARLREKGADVVMTREPGGTRISDAVRTMVLSPEYTEMADRTEILLYAASRAQHVQEVILPALQRGAVVVCDRFVDASIAYQAYGLGQDPQQVELINRFATTGLQPDRTYMLDVPVEVSRSRLLKRAAGSGNESALDRIEMKDREYHERVREAFLLIARKNPQRVLLVNADRTEEEIAADIAADSDSLLLRRF
ncbi:dTMP kinase [Paenibacillus thermotolerans]|uniref:dTMP kinase n=1 Tax=Paenibacillus thermotolerans TaxID=3027807 RepID=UPI0023679927|nr:MULTISPECIES: dTMP kinase [unclassified Paenibacillus]